LNSPFDERKYKRLLKGLEVTVILLSDLVIFNERARIDAEFVKKEYLDIINLLQKKEYKLLMDTDVKILHPSEIKREFVDDGIWFFRTQNLRPLRIEKSNDVYISKNDAQTLKNNEIKYGDILMTRTGANYGQTAIYNLDEKAIASSHVLIIRNNFFNQFYLATFFNTRYGRKMIDKGMYGAAQPEISPYYLLSIPIPIISKKFQLSIEKIYKESEIKEKQSQSLYDQASELLLETIGLKGFKPSKKGTNIKTFKESFFTTRRLDAEYYQPKYEDIENLIKSQKHTYIFKEFEMNKKTIDYKVPEYNYIEIGDINTGNGSYDYNLIITSELPDNAKIASKKNNILISKVRPNRGAITIIQENIPNLVVSGAFTVLKEKTDYKKEVLFVLLRTEYYREWMLKYNVGTSYPVIKNDDILNLPIPIIAKKTQEKIAELIEESFSLRRESEKLLDEAKEMVEREIEE